MQQGPSGRVLTWMAVALLLAGGLSLTAALQAGDDDKQTAAPGDDETEASNIVYVVKDKKQRYSALFRHDTHAAAGVSCNDCHDKIYQKDVGGAKFKMNEITAGKSCGMCHHKEPAAGMKAAFAPLKNCKKCHSVLLSD